ncbi:hypothetical protein [Orbus mooreae]|uniref:hypothetical protein n=1 Tax=Orbus mooreae TaxID=3074107 RepID=UPI00370D6E0D
MNNFKKQVSSQFIQDTIPPSIDYSLELKIQGATEMVAFFVKNNPRAAGKNFLIDLLNSYKASLRLNDEEKEE